MTIRLGQLIYTSFAVEGFTAIASVQVPAEVQHAFVQEIVYEYWDSYNPPGAGYRAAYLHQVTPQHTLFGWLYNDGADDLGRNHVPYFICYYLSGRLQPKQLDQIFICLQRGPVAVVDRDAPLEAIDSVFLTDRWDYKPDRAGVEIPVNIRQHVEQTFKRGELLQSFVPVQPTEISEPGYATALLHPLTPANLQAISGGSSLSATAVVEGYHPELVAPQKRSSSPNISIAVPARPRSGGFGAPIVGKAIGVAAHWGEQAAAQVFQSNLMLKLAVATGALSVLGVAIGGFYFLSTNPLETESRPLPTVAPLPAASSPLAEPASPPSAPSPTPEAAPARSIAPLPAALNGYADAVLSVTLSPDGQTLVSGDEDGTISVWDVSTGQILTTIAAHDAGVRTLALSPNGQHLVSGSDDKTLKVWDLQTGALVQTLCEDTSVIWSVAISANGQTLVSSHDDGTFRVWNLATGEQIHAIQGHANLIFSTAISPDGQTLATGSIDKTVKLWSLETGELLRSINHHTNAVRSVAFSPDGKQLASGSWDHTIAVWDWRTGQLQQSFEGHTPQVVSVRFSADGDTLISGGTDNMIKLWNLETGTLKQSLSSHSRWTLAIAAQVEQLSNLAPSNLAP